MKFCSKKENDPYALYVPYVRVNEETIYLFFFTKILKSTRTLHSRILL